MSDLTIVWILHDYVILSRRHHHAQVKTEKVLRCQFGISSLLIPGPAQCAVSGTAQAGVAAAKAPAPAVLVVEIIRLIPSSKSTSRSLGPH
jgi:hypothetical protein